MARSPPINTYAHLDHICNNDRIAEVQATSQHHYLLRSGIDPTQLDAPTYFADQFARLEAVYDPADGLTPGEAGSAGCACSAGRRVTFAEVP